MTISVPDELELSTPAKPSQFTLPRSDLLGLVHRDQELIVDDIV